MLKVMGELVDKAALHSLLPEHFYISALPKKRKLPKLFRPKELREYVFPELGMIMYDLFWVKYTLFLIKEGYVPWEQEHLFFWANKAGRIDPLKSVLYFSILSKVRSLLTHERDISVGRDFARRWLFARIGWKEKVANGLLDFSAKGRTFDFQNFVEQIFHSDFKNDCVRFGVDLAEMATRKMSEAFESLPPSDAHVSAIKSFCIFIGTLLHDTGIIQNYPRATGAVIDPNINFTRKVLLLNTTEVGALRDLANIDFCFTRKEITILLKRLMQTEQGRYFLASVFLVSYLDPIQNSRMSVTEGLRNIYNRYKNTKNFEDQITLIFSGFEFPKVIFERMEEVCFYWELNFFLSDGETISRKLLQERSIISRGEISKYFEEHQALLRNFAGFLEILTQDSERVIHLHSFIQSLQKTGDTGTSNFMFHLLKSLKQRKEICDVFIDLLLARGTLREIGHDLYSVTGKISKNMSEAIFYGIGPLIDWTTAILRGLRNGK